MIIEPIVLLQQPHHSPRFLKDSDGMRYLQSATEVKGIFFFSGKQSKNTGIIEIL